MINRRGFIGSILALGAAPAIVRADSLMRIVPLELGVLSGFGPFGLEGMIREWLGYDIGRDMAMVRFDIAFGDQQLHVAYERPVMSDDKKARADAIATLLDGVDRGKLKLWTPDLLPAGSKLYAS